MNNFKLTSLADATLGTDALNRNSADDRYYLNSTPLNIIIAPNSSLSMNNQKITNLGTPISNTDAVTKLYVDTNVGIS
jgi:hypothetical protein